MTYTTLDTLPSYEAPVWEGEGNSCRVVNRDAIRWAGDVPPPAIGTQIIVTINNCGPAIVTGYFIEDNWLGLLCRLLDAPAWHKRQNKGDPLGHAFGPEFKLPEPPAT